jgi:hypothetical protein
MEMKKNINDISRLLILAIGILLLGVELKAEQVPSLVIKIDNVCVRGKSIIINVKISNEGDPILIHKSTLSAKCYGVLFLDIVDNNGKSYRYNNCKSIIDAESLELDKTNSVVIAKNDAIMLRYEIYKKDLYPRMSKGNYSFSIDLDYSEITLINSFESFDGDVFRGRLSTPPFNIEM